MAKPPPRFAPTATPPATPAEESVPVLPPMSFRDYVATHAAIGLRIAHWDMATPTVCKLAYDLADAMVKARDQ